MATDTYAPGTSVMPIVRVAVLAPNAPADADTGDDGRIPGRLTDMVLPTGVPLREIMPAVRRLAQHTDDAGEARHATLEQLSLAPVGGAPFSLDATLDTVGVVDGDLLVLAPLPPGPPAPRIVEDVADAAVIFSASREKPWGLTHIRHAATIAAVALILAATAFAAAHRVLAGGQLGLFTAAGVAVATVLAALLTRPQSAGRATVLSVTALAPIAVALGLAVPGDFGAPNLVLAAAGVTAWSIVSITIAERAVAVFTAATVVGVGTLLTAGAAAVWRLDHVVLAAILLVFALFVTVQAAQLSAMWARLPMPVIPAPGDPTPSPLPRRVLEDLPRRVRVGDSHQTGFIAGGVLLSTAGVLILAAPQGVSHWAYYIVVAVALGSALRARVWDSAPCKAWLLAQPFLTAVAFLVVFTVAERYTAAWWALAALAAATAVFVLAALYPRIAEPETYSLPARRLVGFLASGIDASLIPVLAYLVGLFTWVLNR